MTESDRKRSAYKLAMLGLQSDRYARDAEFRDAVDDVLFWATRPAVGAEK